MKFRIEHYGTRLVLNVFRTANWFSEVNRTELNSPLSSVLFCRADVNQWTLALVSIRRRTHAANKWNTCVSVVKLPVITPRVSRRRREMYIGHARLCVCVCVSVCLSPHSHTTARTGCKLGEWHGVPPTCAQLGRFAIDTRVSLLWQHSAERETSASACTRSMPGLFSQ